MGTFMNLAVPLRGSYYRYTEDDSTTVLTVADSGIHDFAVTSPGADNCISLVVTDSSTVTSGYLQGFYTAITLTSDASYSSGSAQINAFATDLALDGTVACEAEGMYIYVYSASALTAISSANISGAVIYLADLKGAASSRSGIQIHIEDGNVASSQDAAVLLRMEGSSCALTNMFEIYCPQYITYFLKTNSGATSGKMIQAFTVGGTQDKVLVCNINGSTYWIPMYAASA